MKKITLALILAGLLASVACFHSPRVHVAAQEITGRTYAEVWEAAVRAVRDMGLEATGMNRRRGLLNADLPGAPVYHYPPRLSIMIRPSSRAVFVECRVSQMGRFGEAVGYGQRNVREFFTALHYHLGYR